ncbi:hypothetical protein [Sphingomonas sp. HMP9]|uniref:hypothetical protein n=1 Tax=Sphingomonas sp. HMP9 TaxID=1517554 RepID=UPI0015970B2B|nr:hypothetical protein [Sphingomonas sp. HMP9]
MKIVSILAMMVFGGSTTQLPAQASTSFCERLAPKLNMKQVGSKPTRATEWRVNTMGLGSHLFGGSSIVSFMVRPAGEQTQAAYDKAAKACTQSTKGIVCRIEGPSELTVQTKGGEAKGDAAAGERAEVELRKASIFCRDV